MSFNKTLLPVPLLPSTASVSPRTTVKLSPSRTCCVPNDLWTSRIIKTCSPSMGVCLSDKLASAMVCSMGKK